jgi:hypothetical protein
VLALCSALLCNLSEHLYLFAFWLCHLSCRGKKFLDHSIADKMNRSKSLYANMSGQVAAAPGSHPVDMPMRQASTNSAMTDDGEAVPTENPKDVSYTAPSELLSWNGEMGRPNTCSGANRAILRFRRLPNCWRND